MKFKREIIAIGLAVIVGSIILGYLATRRPMPQIDQVSLNQLAQLEARLREFVDHLAAKYEFNPKISRMKERMRDTKFIESTEATYTQNKGELISLCGAGVFDHNTMMFVLLHEAAHMYSSSVGHGPEFWRNFRFLLVEASKLGIYTPVDYSKFPVKYCGGKMISDSPLFNNQDESANMIV